MAYYNKVGLLLLSDGRTKFLGCKKKRLSDYLLPWWKYESWESDIDCLKREVKEKLNTELKNENIIFIWEYIDIAAGDISKDVMIRLYEWKITETPEASNEIQEINWLSKKDINNIEVSPIIRNKILPDLIKRKIIL
jgi:8-oxo-dGTP pyrophosphatase MutT (NUDIX family)